MTTKQHKDINYNKWCGFFLAFLNFLSPLLPLSQLYWISIFLMCFFNVFNCILVKSDLQVMREVCRQPKSAKKNPVYHTVNVITMCGQMGSGITVPFVVRDELKIDPGI